MTIKRPEYTCYRCGYCSPKKDHMKRHLYDLKKQCPGIDNNIDLTDEIKECILDNRIYKPPNNIQNVVSINNNTIIGNINTYNQINNLISNINPMNKVAKYFEYKNINPCNFEDMVENRYERDIYRLENDSYRVPKQLRTEDFYDIVDDLTLVSSGYSKDFDMLNSLYDDKSNRLNIYTDGEWQSYLLDKGVICMIDNIKTYYLDTYEVYIIRKIHSDDILLSCQMKNELKERLIEYYRFIVCFGLNTFLYDKNDTQILYNTNDNRYSLSISKHDISHFKIVDTYVSLYNDVKNNLKVIEQSKMQKKIKEIIKYNTKTNISDLNKKVIEILEMDEDFKRDLLKIL